jgi:hypothetical protein
MQIFTRGHRPRHRGNTTCEPLEPRRLFAAELISATAGAPTTTGNGPSPTFDGSTLGGAAAVSDDGRFVAFSSHATDLVAGLTPDGSGDVYVRDRAAGTTVCASVAPDGRPLGALTGYAMSGDGRYVAFSSFNPASADDILSNGDVFVRDLQAGTTTQISRTPSGAQAGGDSNVEGMTPDGRFVIFRSDSNNLDPTTTAPADDIYYYRNDRQTGDTRIVTDRLFGTDTSISDPQISDDGSKVAFAVSTREWWDDTHSTFTDFNVYVKDFATGQTTIATVGPNGAPLDAPPREINHLDYRMSGNGRRIIFTSEGSDVTPDDTNGGADVYLRDLAAGTTTLVTTIPAGTTPVLEFGSFTYGLSITPDGRYAAFSTNLPMAGLPDLMDDSGEGPANDVYVKDLDTGATRVLSTDAAGTLEIGGDSPAMSPDGRYVLYTTQYNLTEAEDPDFFGMNLVLYDLSTGTRTLLNRHADSKLFDAMENDYLGTFSRSGNTLVFEATSLPVGETFIAGVTDTNATTDVVALATSTDSQAPTAAVLVGPLTAQAPFFEFAVNYTDETAMDVASLGTGDVIVTGPNGFREVATLWTKGPATGGPLASGGYRILPPGGVFDAAANGTYTVEAVAGEVKDTAGNALAAGPIGTFTIDIPLGDGPDLQAVSLQGAIKGTLVGGPAGAKQKLKPLVLSVTNAGNQPAAGAFSVRVVASADAVYDTGDATVAELPNQKLKLAPGKSKTLKLKLGALPALPDGDYRLFAVVDAGGALAERLESNNAALLATPVHVAAPFTDVGIASPLLTGRLAAGRKATLLVTARNDGTQWLKGIQPVRVRLTVDPSNPAAVSRTIDTTLKLNLKPGATKALRAKLTLPADLPAGSYSLIVELLPAPGWTDADGSDNAATGATVFSV